MDSEVIFTAGYAGAIVVMAVGIDRVGRAGARRRLRSAAGRHDGEPDLPWPEEGSVALHAAVAVVAVVASLALTAVMMIRHHSVAELVILAVPGLLGCVALRGLSGATHP